MSTIEELLKNPVVWFVWILMAITNNQLTELLAKISHFLSSPFQAGMTGSAELQEKARSATSSGKEYIKELRELVRDALGQFITEFNSLSDPIRENVSKLIDAIAPEDKRIWRIFGALLQMVLFGLFIYADAIQGANNLSTLFPNLVVPEPLRDITFSLLIASVGVVVALGIILADVFGLTHFAPVEKIQGVWKIVYVSIVIITLIIAIGLSTVLALSRVPSLVETLDPAIGENLISNASYAQSYVILPLLVTTAFLYWGAVGVLVLICGFLLFLTVGIKIASFFLGFLKKTIEFGIISSDYLYTLFFGFIELAIRILYGLLYLSSLVISSLMLVAQAVLGVIVGPPLLISKAFMSILNFLLSRFSRESL